VENSYPCDNSAVIAR